MTPSDSFLSTGPSGNGHPGRSGPQFKRLLPLVLGLLAVPLARGATVVPIGIQVDVGPSWRNTAVAKPLDLDQDHVLGTEGYHLVNLSPVLPSYVAESAIVSPTFPGNEGYAVLDDPSQLGNTFLTGTMNPFPPVGQSTDPFTFTLNASAEGRIIRVGLLVDNLDGTQWNASSISLVQLTSLPPANVPVPTVSPLLNNRIPDWIFFEIRDAKAGDRFAVRTVGGLNGAATVGGVVFDSIGPVGGPVQTSSQGAADHYPSRLVLGNPPAGQYKMTLTLSNVLSPRQGMSVLLVGPGGQKMRPMAYAYGAFTAANGQTILSFDDEAPGSLPVLSEGDIPGGSYRPDTDQSPSSPAAPAPQGPYQTTMNALQTGQVAGVWSLYVVGTSVRLDGWRLDMVPMGAPGIEGAKTLVDGETVSPGTETFRGGMTADVKPGGVPTLAWLRWGVGPNLGSNTPPVDLGFSGEFEQFSSFIPAGLGGTFHVQIVASNRFGTTFGPAATVVLPSFVRTFPFGPRPLAAEPLQCADFNNDGVLDLVLSGRPPGDLDGRRIVPEFWRSTPEGLVLECLPNPTPTEQSGGGFGDANNDGFLDFLIAGVGETGQLAQLWLNTGKSAPYFARGDVGGLAGVGPRRVTWGDYDNDGRLDFLLTGVQRGMGQIWRNVGAGFVNVTDKVAPGFPQVSAGAAAWGDYNSDGWLDVVVMGAAQGGAAVTQIWRNTGKGFSRWSDASAPGLPGLLNGDVAWGDYDNDGRLDLLLSGRTSDGPGITQVWRNTAASFVKVTAGSADPIPGIQGGTATWADYDNDGRLDILVVGYQVGSQKTLGLWRNTGSGFSNITDSAFARLDTRLWSAALGDMDNDGRLDLVMAGESANGENLLEISRSLVFATNTPPNPPTGLTVTSTPSGVTFSWLPGTDAQTPARGLSYHLRVGTSPGGSDLVSPMAQPDGRALLPRSGALRPGLSRTITGLPPGQTIYWSVQSQDTSFAGSAFVDGPSFTLSQAIGSNGGENVPGDTNGDGLVDAQELTVVLGKVQDRLRTLNAAGYYSPSQVQALHMGTTLLTQGGPGEFRLTLGLQKATDLTNFVAFPFLPSGTSVNSAGEVEFNFIAPDDAAFYRLEF